MTTITKKHKKNLLSCSIHELSAAALFPDREQPKCKVLWPDREYPLSALSYSGTVEDKKYMAM